MAKRSGNTQEFVKIHSAVNDEESSPTDLFAEHLRVQDRLAEQELKEKQETLEAKRKKKEFYRKIREQAYIPGICVVIVCLALFFYSVSVRNRITGSSQQEVKELQQQAENLRQEIHTLEKTKADLAKDPKVAAEAARNEQKKIAENLVASLWRQVIIDLNGSGSDYSTNEAHNRSIVANGINRMMRALNVVVDYEKTWGKTERIILVNRIQLSEAKTSLGEIKIRVATVPGSGDHALYFRNLLLFDYFSLLSSNDHSAQDVLDNFSKAFNSYLSSYTSADYFAMNDNILWAETVKNEFLTR